VGGGDHGSVECAVPVFEVFECSGGFGAFDAAADLGDVF
jgi:hypothetical protein